MLLQFRKLTRGAIAAIILGLVGIAMVLFLVPSGGLDFSPSNSVATVDGREITTAQLSRELELTLRARRSAGDNISQQEAVEAGLHERLLESMIGRNALFAFAEKVGVSASDAQVGERIRDIPGVLNPVTGSFDQAVYAQFLQQMGYAPPEFEDEIRNELSMQLLMGSLVSGVRAPSSFGELAFAYETETRVISVADAPASIVGEVPPPTDAQIQALYEEMQEQLQVPEYRALTLVYARPADFIARVNVPEARLREEFEARQQSLTQPERRSYVRLAAQNEQQANDAAARLNRGESAEAVAGALQMQLTRGAGQARNEVPDARVAEAVFSQQRGQARAVRGQLTPWAVVRVEEITPAVAPTFESQRDQIREAIAADEAADLLNAAIGAFEEARAAGAPVPEAARQANLPVVTIPAVDASGQAQNGEFIESLVGHEEVIEAAFQTPESEASDFMPIEEADVLVAVDRVIPASVRPLAQVRDRLVQIHDARELGRRMRERMAQVAEAVRGGQSFADAARASGFTVRVNSQTVNRQEVAQLPARTLGTQIFAATAGDVVTDIRADQPGMFAAQVESINRVDPATAPQIVEAARARLQADNPYTRAEGDGLEASFAEALQSEVVARANVQRNERVLERTFNPTAADDQAQ
ncbi:MAG TPA: SurA N-terminal domain-containing protein [Vitreimonas sp.]|uniref:peptidylprolyl isomerase n=1 Tax=Vitreimonas sp. TaxID=3069702 RepID=UPI002D3A7DFB|nr:SurA N-terminal domain-containing protein [Vitreimonas sp.]HYD87495.1 SurA N-terminal domain-containing protein [Vitreimonas sp.]